MKGKDLGAIIALGIAQKKSYYGLVGKESHMPANLPTKGYMTLEKKILEGTQSEKTAY